MQCWRPSVGLGITQGQVDGKWKFGYTPPTSMQSSPPRWHYMFSKGSLTNQTKLSFGGILRKNLWKRWSLYPLNFINRICDDRLHREERCFQQQRNTWETKKVRKLAPEQFPQFRIKTPEKVLKRTINFLKGQFQKVIGIPGCNKKFMVKSFVHLLF